MRKNLDPLVKCFSKDHQCYYWPSGKQSLSWKIKITVEAKATENSLVTNKFNLRDTFKRLERTTTKLVVRGGVRLA
jgi:hypothetical protein